LNENVRNPTVSVSVNVNDIVNGNVNEEKEEERTPELIEPTIIYPSPEIEISEQRKVAPKENNYVLYPIEEIKTRLSEWEHELIENSCKVLNITRDEYQNGVDLFLYQEGEEGLKKDYTEVKRHFRSWLKRNLREIKKTQKQPDKSKVQQIIDASEEAQPIIESYFKNRNNG
jgi:hypothetical protein